MCVVFFFSLLFFFIFKKLGTTPLIAAFLNDQHLVVNRLLDAKADCNLSQFVKKKKNNIPSSSWCPGAKGGKCFKRGNVKFEESKAMVGVVFWCAVCVSLRERERESEN